MTTGVIVNQLEALNGTAPAPEELPKGDIAQRIAVLNGLMDKEDLKPSNGEICKQLDIYIENGGGGGGGGGDDLANLVDGSYTGPFNDNTITTIRSSAFRGETNLTGIAAASVTSIGTHAANGATSLATVSLPSLLTVSDSAFYGCTSLTTVNISGATEVKQDAFNNCTALTSVNASSLRAIGSQAFWNCRNLSHIELPKATSIGAGAFGSCPNLEWVSFDEITSVPTLGNTNAFYTTTLLYFPDVLVDTAKEKPRWSTIADRIKPLSEKPSS